MAQIKSGHITTLSGQDRSESLELGTDTLVGVYAPSSIDAVQIGLQASEDDVGFSDILDGGTPLTISIVGGGYVALDPVQLLGARFVKLVHLDGSGASTTESATRSFTTVFRSFE